MVNFHDPHVMAKEYSACSPQPFSRSQKVIGHIFQVKLRSSRFLCMASSCGPSSHWHSAAPMSQFLIPSWEFVITLDYEWNIIRGRRPYRWTIWVRNHSPLSVCPASATFQCETDCSRESSFTPCLVWPPSQLWL